MINNLCRNWFQASSTLVHVSYTILASCAIAGSMELTLLGLCHDTFPWDAEGFQFRSLLALCSSMLDMT